MLLYSTMLRPCLQCCVLLWDPNYEGHGPAGVIPAEATAVLQGMEYLCYGGRLEVLGLFSLEKRKL